MKSREDLVFTIIIILIVATFTIVRYTPLVHSDIPERIKNLNGKITITIGFAKNAPHPFEERATLSSDPQILREQIEKNTSPWEEDVVITFDNPDTALVLRQKLLEFISENTHSH